MTVEVHRPGSSLVLDSEADYWNDAQLTALRHLGVDRVSRADMQVFHHVCQRTGLDPFARQIYMVHRDGKQVIQTGIDGYRLVARRAVDATGETLSIPGPQWCGPDGVWTDVWLSKEYPAAARVRVIRNGHEFVGIALWNEYVQTTRDKHTNEVRVTKMWDQRSAGQLAKCAEALALRKAFPQDLSGIYVDEELQRHETVQGAVVRRSALGDALAADQQPAQEAEEIEGELIEDTAETPPDDAPAAGPPESPYLNTRGPLARHMFKVLNDAGVKDDERIAACSRVIGRQIATSKEMTDADAQRVIDHYEAQLEQPFAEPGEA